MMGRTSFKYMTKRVKVIGRPSPAFQSEDVHGGKHDLPEAEEEGEGGSEACPCQDGGGVMINCTCTHLTLINKLIAKMEVELFTDN